MAAAAHGSAKTGAEAAPIAELYAGKADQPFAS